MLNMVALEIGVPGTVVVKWLVMSIGRVAENKCCVTLVRKTVDDAMKRYYLHI